MEASTKGPNRWIGVLGACPIWSVVFYTAVEAGELHGWGGDYEDVPQTPGQE